MHIGVWLSVRVKVITVTVETGLFWVVMFGDVEVGIGMLQSLLIQIGILFY